MLENLVPSNELFTLFSELFRKRWDEAAAKSRESRSAFKLEASAIEKKISAMLDRIVESSSPTVIGRYKSEVEKLERAKLVLEEKMSRCGTAAPDYDESFRTAFEFLGNLCNLWRNARSRTSGSC